MRSDPRFSDGSGYDGFGPDGFGPVRSDLGGSWEPVWPEIDAPVGTPRAVSGVLKSVDRKRSFVTGHESKAIAFGRSLVVMTSLALSAWVLLVGVQSNERDAQRTGEAAGVSTFDLVNGRIAQEIRDAHDAGAVPADDARDADRDRRARDRAARSVQGAAPTWVLDGRPAPAPIDAVDLP